MVKGVKVKIGELTLADEPAEQSTDEKANPNPIKIDWSRTNRIKQHEIPAPGDKTIRTSTNWSLATGGGLYTCRMNFKTIKPKKFTDLLDICESRPLVLVQTGTRPSPRWMYITDYQFNQMQGFDDDYIEWNITFSEARD